MNGNKLVYTMIGILLALASAGIGLSIAQGRLEERTSANERLLQQRTEKIATIDVTANEIGHIKSDIETIKTIQKEILVEIRAMEK